MTIDTSYQDQFPVLFAGNAGTIPIRETGTGASVNIKFTFYEAQSNFTHEFSLLCGKVGTDIPLKDILSALRASYDQMTFVRSGLAYFEIRCGEATATWKKYVILGATIPAGRIENILSGRGFISARPQVYQIDDASTEELCIMSSGTSGLRIDMMVYSRDLPPFSVTLASKNDADAIGLISKSISLQSIENLLSESGHPDLDIIAFDAYVVIELEAGKEEHGDALRYIVNRGKNDVFRFYGSYGLLETIYATGSGKSEVQTETKTFINSGVERELVNDSHIQHETFTGWLASADEVRFWQEFFSSVERYAVIDGVSRRIVIDEIDSESTAGELNAFSFKWHYADKYADPSRIPVRKELKQYKPTI